MPDAGTGSAPATVSINVTQDLNSASDLAHFFIGQAPAIFSIGSELVKYAGQPVQHAVDAQPAGIELEGDPCWQLPSGIAFSLEAGASCTICVSQTSTEFSVKQVMDSDDRMELAAGPTSGKVYINIDLDFDIKGSLSGSGTLGGLGIAGKASRSKSATLSYCHPVNETMETEAAIREAFAALVFPFKPDCVLTMPTGSVGKVNFDGKLNCELDLTYGLADYKLSAQSVGLVKDGVSVAGQKLMPPSLDFDTGAEASVVYEHSDNFSAIVLKIDPETARLYLVRSAKDETRESVGVNVGISLTSVSASVDPSALSNSIATVTKAKPANLASQVASYVPDIESNLVDKANDWLCDKNIGLMASLSQEKDRAMLFAFSVDLSSVAAAELAKQSWAYFVSGDLHKALQIPSFTLLPGSGVAEHLKHSSSIELHFFNFQLAKTTDFFKNSVTRLGSDGSILFFANVGEESRFSTQSKSTTATIHFVATASEDVLRSNYENVEVDLCMELSEKNNSSEATKIANSIGALGQTAQVVAAEQKMLGFVEQNKNTTLTLMTVFKASSYGKLTCSPYAVGSDNNVHPPGLPQQQDANNWDAFHNMVVSLMPDLAYVVSGLNYATWMSWNVQSNNAIGAPVNVNHVPDRRSLGNTDAASQALFGVNWTAPNNFMIASTRFMNLCNQLESLASSLAQVDTATEWDNLISTITTWVKADGIPDWSKAALGALLSLCGSGGQSTIDFQQSKDDDKMTCTLTLS